MPEEERDRAESKLQLLHPLLNPGTQHAHFSEDCVLAEIVSPNGRRRNVIERNPNSSCSILSQILESNTPTSRKTVYVGRGRLPKAQGPRSGLRLLQPRAMQRKWEEKLKRIENQAAHYERNPLGSAYKPRLARPEDPPSIWKLFQRQAQAFNFVKTCREAVHVFALEDNLGDGHRIYLVTTYSELWHYYKARKNQKSLMHCYEVIPENTVCKLYFDLEFDKAANPGKDGQKMVAQLIERVSEALQESFGVSCSAEDVLNLDSSTAEKFSRHLIFQLRDAAFKDNIHVGRFVQAALRPALSLLEKRPPSSPATSVGAGAAAGSPRRGTGASAAGEVALSTAVVAAAEEPRSSGPGGKDLAHFLVESKAGGKQLFVDLGVYTRNRNFRLYKSSKRGKSATLEVAEDNRFFPTHPKNVSEEERYFLSSLISNIRFSETLRVLTCDLPGDKERKTLHRNSSGPPAATVGGSCASPYPELDEFVLSLVDKGGVKGGIRCWNYFFPEELLVYDISRYRWCANIGRAHKSNNIMILVDLKNEIWYQKCHDPACRAENFKSEGSPLPPDVCLPFLFREEEEDAGLTLAERWQPGGRAASPAADWDVSDEASLLEATDDAELAAAAESSSPPPACHAGAGELPDAVLVAALQEHEEAQAR
ncbi:DNA-directed primase/polymerase protein [Tachyglossus aculeatus]|uniref:DNA-directed primase/polymerase protein n=1 Tax=Tachyglossus aculeatus TaxID=9261 RepID=UPI0018F651B6|nr:DNA-directed primase/polymerase protein [Tachyglossus aculeatus]